MNKKNKLIQVWSMRNYPRTVMMAGEEGKSIWIRNSKSDLRRNF